MVLVYDLYPDALDAAGRSPGRWLRSAMQAANRYVFAKADAVVFPGDWISELARARYGEPASWSVIQTGAAVGEFETAASTPFTVNVADWCAGRRLASYVGNLGQTHDWETLAGAFDRLAAAGVDRQLAVLIAASGPGAASLRQATTHLSEGFVRFEPPLSDADWTGVMSNTDIALVSLRPEAAASSIPSKAFSALAAGSALVAIVPPCDISAIIAAHDCGAVVAPGDDEALAATLESLASDDQRLRTLARNAREVAGEHFDLTRLVSRWHDVVVGIERSRVAP